jgi:hypothetical protein
MGIWSSAEREDQVSCTYLHTRQMVAGYSLREVPAFSFRIRPYLNLRQPALIYLPMVCWETSKKDGNGIAISKGGKQPKRR